MYFNLFLKSEKQRQILFAGVLSTYLRQLGLGQSKARRQEYRLGLPHGGGKYLILEPSPVASQETVAMSRKLNRRWDWNSGTLIHGVGIPTRPDTCPSHQFGSSGILGTISACHNQKLWHL